MKGVHGERDSELLASCYRNSLALAAEHGLQSVAFPAISTGIYFYPRDEAAAIASQTIVDFLARSAVVKQVVLVFYSERDATVFLNHHRFPDAG